MTVIINGKEIALFNTVEAANKVTLTNKTGSNITKGQKIWCNLDVVEQSTKIKVDTISSYIRCPFVVPSGEYVYSNATYLIGSSSVTQQDSNTHYGFLRYDTYFPEYAAVQEYYLCYGQGELYLKINDELSKYLGYGFCYDTSLKTLGLIDSYGAVLKTKVMDSSQHSLLNLGVFLNDKVFNIYTLKYGTINRETLDLTVSTLTVDNKSATYIFGITGDEKYILCSTSGSNMMALNTTSGGTLSIYEKVEEGHYKCLSYDEVPVELKPFVVNKSTLVYNINNNILTCATVDNTKENWCIFKYENGTFNKLPVDFGFTETEAKQCCLITLSNDMLVACVQLKTASEASTNYIYRLISSSGYDAIPYKYSLLTESMFTGIALENAEPGQQFKASCYV